MVRVELLTYAGIVAACWVWVVARFVRRTAAERRTRGIEFPADRAVPLHLHLPNRLINARRCAGGTEGREGKGEKVRVGEVEE